jgi:hypothetical protein
MRGRQGWQSKAGLAPAFVFSTYGRNGLRETFHYFFGLLLPPTLRREPLCRDYSRGPIGTCIGCPFTNNRPWRMLAWIW